MTEEELEMELEACETALKEAGLPKPDAMVTVGEKGPVVKVNKDAEEPKVKKKDDDTKKKEDVSEGFKIAIKSHLDKFASENELFAKKYQNPKKNLDDCCTYILNTVKATGRMGFADDEIFNMANHYYDEDDIDVGTTPNAKVITNYTIDLSDEEKEKIRQDAIRKVQNEEIAKLRSKPKQKPKQESEELTLF